MDAAIPADAQNAPTGIWKSRTEREIPTAPTPIIVVVNERKNNGDSNSVAKPSTESDQAHGQVKQGEQEGLHARDSVGQTSGATQRYLKPGCSQRIGNSRRTWPVPSRLRSPFHAVACTRTGRPRVVPLPYRVSYRARAVRAAASGAAGRCVGVGSTRPDAATVPSRHQHMLGHYAASRRAIQPAKFIHRQKQSTRSKPARNSISSFQ